MPDFIASLAEKSIIGSAFFYLLYNSIKNMDSVVANMNTFGVVLQKVSDTLLKIDIRMEVFEERLKKLEER